MCVRCGKAPRFEDTYICFGCTLDPATQAETKAVAWLPGTEARRRALVTAHGWAGSKPGCRWRGWE